MGIHGKTEVIRSLDSLIYCHVAYSYFLDASLIALAVRAFLQLPLLSARTANQTLQTAIMVTTIGFLICLLIHAHSTPGQPGLLIDFVGNQHLASILRVIFVDVSIYVLQLVRIMITSTIATAGTAGAVATSTTPLTQPLVSALHNTHLAFVLPSAPGATPSPSLTATTFANEDQHNDTDLFYGHGLVADIELRPSLRSILSQTPSQPDPINQLPV